MPVTVVPYYKMLRTNMMAITTANTVRPVEITYHTSRARTDPQHKLVLLIMRRQCYLSVNIRCLEPAFLEDTGAPDDTSQRHGRNLPRPRRLPAAGAVCRPRHGHPQLRCPRCRDADGSGRSGRCAGDFRAVAERPARPRGEAALHSGDRRRH